MLFSNQLWNKVLGLVTSGNSDFHQPRLVPHFLDRHCADPLMRDLRSILLISVTIHYNCVVYAESGTLTEYTTYV